MQSDIVKYQQIIKQSLFGCIEMERYSIPKSGDRTFT